MRRRGLVQNSALALAGDLASKAGIFALMIVAARGLSTPQFALLASALATATVLTAGLDLGSQTLLTRDGVAGPEARGSIAWALARARIPIVIACFLVAAAIGAAGGRLVDALATVALAVAGAAQLSLTGALRSAQDLRPEALSRLAGGVCTLAAGAVCVALAGDAAAILIAVAVASVLTLAPMIHAARGAIRRGPPVGAWNAIRAALPLGVMAVATLVYYRSGTIALAAVSTSRQTAAFAAASTIGFGLLSLGNAVTTGLLPRLAAADEIERAAVTRRALVWTTALAAVLGAGVAGLARPLVTLGFGARYAAAATPLAILALSTILIAAGGVLGTALIAAGRIRPVAIQVGASLLVNLLVLALLAPKLGAEGAALATLACEAVALAILARAAIVHIPGLSGDRSPVATVHATAAAGPSRG
jgi:O-antigen/teichoic acid export membrane protein